MSLTASSQITLYLAARVTLKNINQLTAAPLWKPSGLSHPTEKKTEAPYSGLKALAGSPSSSDGIPPFSLCLRHTALLWAFPSFLPPFLPLLQLIPITFIKCLLYEKLFQMPTLQSSQRMEDAAMISFYR